MTAEELEKILEGQKKLYENKGDNTITFNSKSVITTLIGVAIISIVTASISLWTNDKDQDNTITNMAKSINQTQENQIILGQKFDAFAAEPRYTKKQHDTEMQVEFNDIKQLGAKVEKNTIDINQLQESHTQIINKMGLIEVRLENKN